MLSYNCVLSEGHLCFKVYRQTLHHVELHTYIYYLYLVYLQASSYELALVTGLYLPLQKTFQVFILIQKSNICQQL